MPIADAVSSWFPLPHRIPARRRWSGGARDRLGAMTREADAPPQPRVDEDPESSEAFKVLRAGDPDKHNEILLDEIDGLSQRTDAIVMAQVSMSVLEPHLTNTRVPVYNSGRTGFEHARSLLEHM